MKENSLFEHFLPKRFIPNI